MNTQTKQKAIYVMIALIGLFIVLHCTLPVHAATSADGVVVVSEGVNEEDGNTIIGFYNRLPSGIRQALSNGGYRYTVKNQTCNGHHGNTQISGFLYSTWSDGRAREDVNYNGGIINHEIGHVVDLMYNGYQPIYSGDPYGYFHASNTPEWQSLYEHYKSTIAGFGGLSRYEVYNRHEAFAESYGHVTNNRAMVLRKAPEIVAYIDMVNQNVMNTYHTASAVQNTPEVEALKTSAYNSEEFNAYSYYIRYADLQQAFGANDAALYEHYISYGRGEGRNPL